MSVASPITGHRLSSHRSSGPVSRTLALHSRFFVRCHLAPACMPQTTTWYGALLRVMDVGTSNGTQSALMLRAVNAAPLRKPTSPRQKHAYAPGNRLREGRRREQKFRRHRSHHRVLVLPPRTPRRRRRGQPTLSALNYSGVYKSRMKKGKSPPMDWKRRGNMSPL